VGNDLVCDDAKKARIFRAAALKAIKNMAGRAGTASLCLAWECMAKVMPSGILLSHFIGRRV
jgi:hypothetical protein